MEGTELRVCQYCATYYDPKRTFAPRGYCSQEHANIGERAYSKVIGKNSDLVTLHPAEIREMIGWIDSYHVSWASACHQIRNRLVELLKTGNFDV